MANNFGGFSSYTEGKIPAANDGGHGSGVPNRHNVNLDANFDYLPTENKDAIGIDKKKFTEKLHSRQSNGRFEPSSMRGREPKE
jgi:hypothetical protein